MTPSLRARLARHYEQLGLMEHASIAAFARFTLQLLGLGAPADLLRATHEALGDETLHAQLCFGLASAYAGRACGPGELRLEGAFDGAESWLDIVSCAFLEACIGETLAAAEARAALDGAQDPAVRAALTRIADDEARHAELGFRFVSWALRAASASRRESALARLGELLAKETAALQSAPLTPEEKGAPTLVAHGLLSTAETLAVRRAALVEVVLPCAHALGLSYQDVAA